MDDNERLDREGVRTFLAWIIPATLVMVCILAWILLYYKQGPLLGEIIRAVLYAVAGGVGAGAYMSRSR